MLVGLAVYRLMSNDPGGDPAERGSGQVAVSTDYSDLISLFEEFRAFQQGDSGNIQSYSQSGWILSGVDESPDFSTTAMADKYGELRSFQERLSR